MTLPRTSFVFLAPAFLLALGCGGDDFHSDPTCPDGVTLQSAGCPGGAGGTEAGGGGGAAGAAQMGGAGGGIAGTGGTAGHEPSGGTAGTGGGGANGGTAGTGGGNAGAGGTSQALPEVIVSGIQTPESLAVDDENVYWTATGNNVVMKALKDGSGAPTKIADAIDGTSLQVDDSYVYWVASNDGNYSNCSIFRWPKKGGASQVVSQITAPSDSTPYVIRIAGDDIFLFATYELDFVVQSLPKSGGMPTTVVKSYGAATGLLIDGTSLFWANYTPKDDLSRIFVAPKDGSGEPSVVVAGSSLESLGDFAIDSQFLYWQSCSKGAGPCKMIRASKDGSGQVLLAPEGEVGVNPFPLIGDDDGLYWPSDTAVKMYAKNSGAIRTLANAPEGFEFLATDQKYVYWTTPGAANTDEIIFRVAK